MEYKEPFVLEEYVVVSDVHGNLEALVAIILHAKNRKITQWISLGDVVGYGPDSWACLLLLSQLGCTFLIGNHERLYCEAPDSGVNPMALHAIEMMRKQGLNINAEQRQMLEGLIQNARPYYIINDAKGEPAILLVHAAPIFEVLNAMRKGGENLTFDELKRRLPNVDISQLWEVYILWKADKQGTIAPEDAIQEVEALNRAKGINIKACLHGHTHRPSATVRHDKFHSETLRELGEVTSVLKPGVFPEDMIIHAGEDIKKGDPRYGRTYTGQGIPRGGKVYFHPNVDAHKGRIILANVGSGGQPRGDVSLANQPQAFQQKMQSACYTIVTKMSDGSFRFEFCNVPYDVEKTVAGYKAFSAPGLAKVKTQLLAYIDREEFQKEAKRPNSPCQQVDKDMRDFIEHASHDGSGDASERKWYQLGKKPQKECRDYRHWSEKLGDLVKKYKEDEHLKTLREFRGLVEQAYAIFDLPCRLEDAR